MVSTPIFILLILSLSSILHPVASVCGPRTYPYHRLLSNFLPPPSALPSANSPNPSPHLRPRPSSLSPAPTPSYSSPLPYIPPTPSLNIHSAPPSQPSSSFGSLQSVASSMVDSVSNAIHSLQAAFLDGSVKAICDKTDHPDVCISSIQSLAPNLGHADARTVLKLAMKAAADNAHVALHKANELVNDPNNDKLTKSIFSVCADGFEDALSDLHDAAKALEGDDKGTMISDLSALFSDFGGCGDAFTDAKKVSPLKEFEDLLTQHASNCLAIGDLI